MLRDHRAGFGWARERLVAMAVVLCGLLVAASCGVATPHEAQAEEPARAARQDVAPLASAKGSKPAEGPERSGDVSRETDVGKLIAQLKATGDDGESSVLAAEALGEMGVEAEPAIVALIQAFADERRASGGRMVADAAARALAKIGRPAVAPLIKALHNHDAYIRGHAADALARMGAKAEPAVAALAEALCSLPATGEWDTLDFLAASASAKALAEIGRPGVSALAKALHHGSEEVRMCAMVALGEIGAEAGAAAPDLKQLLAAEEPFRVHWRALEVYAVVEPDKKEAVRLLSSYLRDRDSKVRSHAAVLLGKLGPKAAGAVIPLIDGLDDNGSTRSSRFDPNWGINRPVCCDMAEALGKIGEAARPALPKLSAMMTHDERLTVRISAALAVFQIDPPNREALQQVIRILEEDLGEDSEGTGALEAVVALADVGPRGRDAIPAIGKALHHRKPFLRSSAAGTLSSIGGPEAVPFLIFACRDPNAMVRTSAVGGLHSMGEVAAPAVPALVKLLEETADTEWFEPYPIYLLTIEALESLAPWAASAIPALEEASQSEEQYFREAAVAALEKIRSASAGARPPGAEAAMAQTEEAAAIDQIEKCGARVTVDTSQSGQLSVSVEYWEYCPTDGALAQLKRLSDVRSLDLSSTRTTDAGLAHLSGLTELQSLDLSHTEITDAGLTHLKGLVQLQSLDLAETMVVGPGLENLAGMTQLRKLILASRREGSYPPGPGRFDDTALRHLRGLVNLRILDLTRTSITDAGMAYVGQLKGLETLNLWNRGVTDAGLAHLRELGSLRSLDLRGRSITDASVTHLKRLGSLRKLRLDGTRITKAGVKSLRQALPKATIETDMSEDWTTWKIESLGGRITGDKNHPDKPVIGIDLSKARIGDADAAAVAEFPRLETLDLSETEVTDAGLVHLKGLSQLRELNLRHTQITDRGIKTLQRALPECDIRR